MLDCPREPQTSFCFKGRETGDQAAFLELYDRYRQPIFRFAYRLLGSVEIAEDVTHDCFLSLIRKPENFRPDRASLKTYLFAAARNLALKHFRDQGREAAMDEVTQEPQDSPRRGPLRRLLDEELGSSGERGCSQSSTTATRGARSF